VAFELFDGPGLVSGAVSFLEGGWRIAHSHFNGSEGGAWLGSMPHAWKVDRTVT
jgi:hypothetical protein